MYTVTNVKASRTAATIAEALRLADQMDTELQPAMGQTITRQDTGACVSFEFTKHGALAVDDAQDLLRLAGVDPREDDPDGFHWPYAPSAQEVIAALERWTTA